jgi:hypothetical protein
LYVYSRYVSYGTLVLGAALFGSGCVQPGDTSSQLKPFYTQEQVDKLPKDMYETNDPRLNEQNFEKTIENSGLVLVQYCLLNPPSDKHIYNGNRFWNRLKTDYGNTLDGYITITVPNISSFSSKIQTELGKDMFPSYALYDKGIMVTGGIGKPARIRGAPDYANKPEEEEKAINFIKRNSDSDIKKRQSNKKQ